MTRRGERLNGIRQMKYFVYILQSLVDRTFYTGQTNNLKDRLRRHNAGLIKSTKAKQPYQLSYYEEYETRKEAMWREWELKKKFTKEQKQQLVENFETEKINTVLGT
jgi:putative endonuclease